MSFGYATGSRDNLPSEIYSTAHAADYIKKAIKNISVGIRACLNSCLNTSPTAGYHSQQSSRWHQGSYQGCCARNLDGADSVLLRTLMVSSLQSPSKLQCFYAGYLPSCRRHHILNTLFKLDLRVRQLAYQDNFVRYVANSVTSQVSIPKKASGRKKRLDGRHEKACVPTGVHYQPLRHAESNIRVSQMHNKQGQLLGRLQRGYGASNLQTESFPDKRYILHLFCRWRL